MSALSLELERIIESSIARFKASLGWKANFIDDTDIEAYRVEIRRVIVEARSR